MDIRRRRRRMLTMATRRRHHLMDILMDHRRKVCVFVGNSHSFVLGSWILDQECVVVNMLWNRSKINSLHSLYFFLFPFW